MLKPNEIEKVSMALDKPMRNLENQIMQDIVRRIKTNGEITRSADWQIYRLHELGMAKEDIKTAIQQNLNLSDEEIHDMYYNVAKSGYSHDKSVYTKAGLSQIPFKKNEELQQLLSAVSGQTGDELKNISQSLGFAIKQPNGSKLAFTEVGEYYQKTLDSAVMGIATGVFDYNTVIKKTIAEMTNSGLRTVDYASGWSNRVDVAARRSIMTGLSQLTAKVNEQNAKELDTDYFEISWHRGARPSHQVWQGKVYSQEELESVCGLGTVQGLCGSNCYHDYYPFIPGISEPTYTDEQLAQMNSEENKPVTYNGKEYTKYEALQRQRKLETTMRAQRQQIKLLEYAGADEDDIINARCRYHGTSQDYTAFSKAMDLPQQRARVTADGLGNIGVGKYKVDNAAPANISVKEGKTVEVDVPAPPVQGNTEVYVDKKVDNAKESGIIEEKKSEWDNGLEPHGQLDVKFVDDDGDDLYSFVADELQVSKEKAIEYADSVMGFTDLLYSDIRSFQRGEIADEEIKGVSESLEEYIKKAPRWNGGTTYRGSTISDEELSLYKQGHSLSMGGTASWSDKESVAIDFATRNTSGERPNEVIYHCETQNKGTAIRHLSVYENESEVLCSKESEYIVDKVEGGYGRYHVYLKEVE